MRNVTITLEEEVARWAKVWAAEHDTSVSRFLGELLKARMRRDQEYQATMTQYWSRQGMSRALLKLSGSLVHDYATISDDSPSPNRASRARRAATSAGIS